MTMREQLQHAATTLCLLTMGCTDTHILSDDAAGDAGAPVDARTEDSRRVDANAPDANAELATIARYWEDGRPVADAFVIFGNAEGDIVEVVRTGSDGRASSLRFEAGTVTAVDARNSPRFFEVRTGILRGDVLVFGRNDHPGNFSRGNLVIAEPFPGAVRYRIAHRDVTIGEPLDVDDFYRGNSVGFTAEAIDASNRVIAQSWIEGGLRGGETRTFAAWGESVAIPVSIRGAPYADVTLYVAVEDSYRRAATLGPGGVMMVPAELIGRRSRVVATFADGRSWSRRGILSTAPIAVTPGPAMLCGNTFALDVGPRPRILVPETQGDQTSVIVVANIAGGGRLGGHRSNWWISVDPAHASTVRLPEIPSEVGEYVESAIATMLVYGTGWDDPAVMGFAEARTTLGPADDTFGHNVRVGPDGEVFTCTRTSNFMAADRDEDGLPDTNDPCPDDRDDGC